MMSFGGPIDSMQISQKSNNRLLKGRKRLKEIQQDYKVSKPSVTQESDRQQESFVDSTYQFQVNSSNSMLIIKVILTLGVVAFIAWAINQLDWNGIIDTIQ